MSSTKLSDREVKQTLRCLRRYDSNCTVLHLNMGTLLQFWSEAAAKTSTDMGSHERATPREISVGVLARDWLDRGMPGVNSLSDYTCFGAIAPRTRVWGRLASNCPMLMLWCRTNATLRAQVMVDSHGSTLDPNFPETALKICIGSRQYQALRFAIRAIRL